MLPMIDSEVVQELVDNSTTDILKLYLCIVLKGNVHKGIASIARSALSEELKISDRTLWRRKKVLEDMGLLTVSRGETEVWTILLARDKSGSAKNGTENDKVGTINAKFGSENICAKSGSESKSVVSNNLDAVSEKTTPATKTGPDIIESISTSKNTLTKVYLKTPVSKVLINTVDKTLITPIESIESIDVKTQEGALESKESIDSTETRRKKTRKKSRELKQKNSSTLALPTQASEKANEKLEYPLPRISLQSSLVWYWAINRYKLHDLDIRLNSANFTRYATTYARNLIPSIGKDWTDSKNYVDWYLSSRDDFIRRQCAYSFEFMSSAACYNQYLADKPKLDTGFVVNEQARAEMLERIQRKISSADT